MELILKLDPCMLCYLQRGSVICIGVTCLIALIHKRYFLGYILISVFFSLLGSALAIRQLYLQGLPPESSPSCGPDFNYLIQNAPFTEIFLTAIKGDGNCAEILWQFLGLSIPGWLLLALSLIVGFFIISLKKLKTSL